MSVKSLAASVSLIALATTVAYSNENKFDAKVQKAASDIAAAQLGDIRGSIDYDETPVFVKRRELNNSQNSSQLGQSLSPRPAWVPEADSTKLPPVSKHLEGVDNTSTGSIEKSSEPAPLIDLWERFDKYGNRVDRFGNRLD